MTSPQVKKLCKQMHKGKRFTVSYYLIKYPVIGWTLGTPEEFSTRNTEAIDFECFTL